MKKLLAALILLCSTASAQIVPGEVECTESNCTIYNQAMVHTETGEKLNLAWACVTDCNGADTEYAVELRRFPPVDTDVAVTKATIPYSTFRWSASLPRAGVYYLRVQSCLIGKRDAASCSAWSNSFDSISTKFPRGWVVEVKVKSPTF